MSYLIKFIRNTFLTTGISMFLLACFATVSGGSCIFIATVFQNLMANACIHLGFLFTKQFESSYFLLNASIDVAVTAAIILVFGYFFKWFTSTPPVILLIMVVLVYLFSCAFQIVRVQADIHYINEQLKKRQS